MRTSLPDACLLAFSTRTPLQTEMGKEKEREEQPRSQETRTGGERGKKERESLFFLPATALKTRYLLSLPPSTPIASHVNEHQQGRKEDARREGDRRFGFTKSEISFPPSPPLLPLPYFQTWKKKILRLFFWAIASKKRGNGCGALTMHEAWLRRRRLERRRKKNVPTDREIRSFSLDDLKVSTCTVRTGNREKICLLVPLAMPLTIVASLRHL